MESKKQSIPYPADEEIEQQVAYIIKQGLPVKQSFIHLLLDLKRQIAGNTFSLAMVRHCLVDL
ncbi:hypothetical protein [Lysinibacillus pakistanensis]|uniref:hypothetical protein n=1 Tax=Lysinibacillus pakistanensis TaxID=759811 RepID=UPI003D2C19C0